MTADTVETRLAVLTTEIEALGQRLAKVEQAVDTLRLHEARLEPFERVMWSAIGAAVPIVLAWLFAVVRLQP